MKKNSLVWYFYSNLLKDNNAFLILMNRIIVRLIKNDTMTWDNSKDFTFNLNWMKKCEAAILFVKDDMDQRSHCVGKGVNDTTLRFHMNNRKVIVIVIDTKKEKYQIYSDCTLKLHDGNDWKKNYAIMKVYDPIDDDGLYRLLNNDKISFFDLLIKQNKFINENAF